MDKTSKGLDMDKEAKVVPGQSVVDGHEANDVLEIPKKPKDNKATIEKGDFIGFSKES